MDKIHQLGLFALVLVVMRWANVAVVPVVLIWVVKSHYLHFWGLSNFHLLVAGGSASLSILSEVASSCKDAAHSTFALGGCTASIATLAVACGVAVQNYRTGR